MLEANFMREALELAEKRMLAGDGGPFGAVIVADGEIVGRGWNRVTSTCDPTAHAEVCAIRDACTKLKRFSLKGCVLYSSCEPCPMCLAAILWARLDEVIFAAGCEDAAAAGFDDGHFYRQVALPIEKRELPMRQQLREEGKRVFDAWLKFEDRVEY
ncbi:MAG: nucleoside deaminase [Pirellulaceae bacterium]